MAHNTRCTDVTLPYIPQTAANKWLAECLCQYALVVALVWIGTALAQSPPPSSEDILIEAPLPDEHTDYAYATGEDNVLSSRGSHSVLVVFAQFKGEAPNDVRIPDFARDLFDPDLAGSFTHFYRTMSQGQLQVEGAVLPRRYVSERPASAYLARRDDEHGRYGEFVQEILRQVDADVDLGRFDNDGPDGAPNSGDDDGLVDYLVISLRSAPRNFLYAGATGIANLGFGPEKFVTADLAASGAPIGIDGSRTHGTILRATKFTAAVSAMAHEFGHALGLPDLYDRSHLYEPGQSPDQDSAGIGRWGLMGKGTNGWLGNDGPTGFCAWSLEQLGWIGQDNDRLIEMARDTSDVSIDDLFRDGAIYKIPLGTELKRITKYGLVGDVFLEYLLLEHRVRHSHHYNRNMPGEGLLVWHVREFPESNDHEDSKLVDLVCADGLYRDAGDAQGDNLDFWSRDKDYRTGHGGNEGDAGDPFDGIRYRRLDSTTNPSSPFASAPSQAFAPAGLRIERRGETVYADIDLPFWSGRIDDEVHWLGNIRVDGDLTVGPEGTLVLYPDARVQVAGTDRLRAGRDAQRVEVHIEGLLQTLSSTGALLYHRRPRTSQRSPITLELPLFEPQVPHMSWHGITPESAWDSTQIVVRGTFASELLLASPETATAVTSMPEAIAADTFALGNNFPNPFTRQTALPYSLAAESPVSLTIYNAVGQSVCHLVDDYQSAGPHEAVWTGLDDGGRAVGSGVYLYRLDVSDRFSAGGKMLRLSSGYAQVREVDVRMKAVDDSWSLTPDDLTAPSAALGYGEPTTAQIAFTVGTSWVTVEAWGVQGQDREMAQRGVRQLTELVALLDPDPEQRRALRLVLDRLLDGVDADRRAALTTSGRQHLVATVQPLGEGVTAYFYLGEWLQTLRAGLLSAGRLQTPLHQVLDPGADADAARVFGAYLQALQEDPALVAGLDRVAELLDANPRSGREIDRLLDQVENIVDAIRIR